MITNNIKNSNGQIVGVVEIYDNSIIIKNQNKPILEITDNQILQEVKSDSIVNSTLEILYNEYKMSIGEIAGVYNRCYSNMNKLLKANPNITFNKEGRRNRAFGHPVSTTQSAKMSQSLKGRKSTYYERTPEIRQKISNSLKDYFKEHPQNPEPHQKNWANGVYDNVDFQIGIGGHFTSLKMNTTFRFRSLLELFYFLKIEEDPEIISYTYEPFHIIMDNGKSYMPDFMLNNKVVIELKAKKYVERVEGVEDKVKYKEEQGKKYCSAHNLIYKIIYDEDIGFESKKMKYYIRDNPDIVKKYNISFNKPERMVIK